MASIRLAFVSLASLGLLLPACAEKVLFTVITGGETARFSYSEGQLYRRLGRKEVPIKQ